MKAVGLVVEYNPFHNGHRYHLARARAITGADVVVAVMSGNFTQRGEPTVIDKWQRTRAALLNGVDLVIELPVFMAVQPAHRFAAGAVGLLNDLGVSDLVFGAEHPDWDFLAMVAAAAQFDSAQFHDFKNTYATQFNQALEAAVGHQLTDPNDILAFAYYRAWHGLGTSQMQLHPIQRRGAGYHDHDLQGAIASASAIRRAVAAGSPVAKTVPAATARELAGVQTVPSLAQLYPLLRNHLIQTPTAELARTYQVEEGLENRLKEAAERSRTFTDWVAAVKTKRYTYSRIMRVAFYLLLNLTGADYQRVRPYHRVLGFSPRGQEYLHQVKKHLTEPLVTKVGQAEKGGLVNLDYRAGKLYQNFTAAEQDLKRAPVRVSRNDH